MLKEPLTLYKLIVLYMLNRVDFSLTKAQIMDFILERDYTNFLTLQQVIGELIDTNMITADSIKNRTHLTITDEGVETLSYFKYRIGEGMRADVDAFFRERELEMRNELSVTGDYYKSVNGEYEARLRVKEKDVTLVDITMSVPDEGTADVICGNWRRKNPEIYKFLVETLFQE